MMKKITFLLLLFICVSLSGQDKLTSSLEEEFDGTTYSKANQTTYIYDNNNNLVEENYYYWDSEDSEWVESSSLTFTYNANNKVIQEIRLYSGFDFSTNSIVVVEYKTMNTYNANGDIVEIINEEYKNAVLEESSRTDITYVNGKLSSALHYKWNGTAWVYDDDIAKSVLEFNTQGKLSTMSGYTWNGSDFEISEQTVLTYDAENNLILSDDQEWEGAAWVTKWRTERTFDANKNTITRKEYYYDETSATLILDLNETSEYDTTMLMSSFTHPFKDKTGLDQIVNYEHQFVNKILTTTSADVRTTYNYGSATASVKDFNLENLSIYPNPTTSILQIDDRNFTLKNIDIYNILGKKVMTSTKNKVNVENLVNGVYLVKIQDDKGNSTTKKIVKN